MRCLLLAFSLGVVILQQQASLPSPWQAAFALLPLPVALACAVHYSRGVGTRRNVRAAGLLLAALSCGMAGFFYAAWRADARLGDALPPAWEDEDIRLVGVVDDLPQPTDRGTRFAFAVEKILTPGAVVPSRLSLAWYNGWLRDVDAAAIPEIHAGERWALTVPLKRPHGTINPHGFDVEAWLLQNELLTGDIEARTETDLVRREAARLRSDLLVVPHHGSRTSSTPAFIAAVQPEIAAFTPGYRNRFGHPRSEIVERYVAAGARHYRTDNEGALTFTFADGLSYLPRRERVDDARYWRDAPTEGELPPID